MHTRLTIGALSALAMIAGACSSKSTSPYPDVQSFCNAKAKAECQIASLCGVDLNGCQTRRASLCNRDALDATASGTRSYTPDNAQGCIDAVNGAYGNGSGRVTFAQLVGPGSVTDKCQRVFSGNADKLHTCTSDYDCAANRICTPTSPGAPQSVCADPVKKNESDPCADPGSICAQDTHCAASDAGVLACLPAAQPGQPCSPTSPCVTSQRCVAGACRDRVVDGQKCVTHDDCAAAAPYCDAYAGSICRLGLTFAVGGLDCTGFQAGDAGAPGSVTDGAVVE